MQENRKRVEEADIPESMKKCRFGDWRIIKQAYR